MKTKEDQILRNWIDNASYSQLLQRWRHAPAGDRMFAGNLGIYYSSVMAEKKRSLTNDEQVKVSKQIGWDNERV